jgi:hypothetical protein
MQRELREAADAGFEYMGQTVFNTTFGGDEVVVILERDKDAKPIRFEYRRNPVRFGGAFDAEGL